MHRRCYHTFNGTTAGGWQHANGDDAKWTVADNSLTVKPGTGGTDKQNLATASCISNGVLIKCKRRWTDQNSGIFLMGRYEVQVLDNYNNINKRM
jgi:hypothetical protein